MGSNTRVKESAVVASSWNAILVPGGWGVESVKDPPTNDVSAMITPSGPVVTRKRVVTGVAKRGTDLWFHEMVGVTDESVWVTDPMILMPSGKIAET